MDTCLPDWNTEVGVDFPLPVQRKPLGLENEMVELLWQNGEVVLNTQTNKKQSKQAHKHDQSNPNNPIQDYETISLIDYPIDESFEKEFYTNFLSGIPSSNHVEPNKPFGKSDNEKPIKFGSSEANHVSLPLPPPSSDQDSESVVKTDNDVRLPVKKHAISRAERGPVTECSVRTINSSHCASNQVVVNDIDMIWASSSCGIGSKTVSAGVEEKYARNVSPRYERTEKETFGRAITSCSGGSGSSFWNQSNETNCLKRKSRDVEESECRSDATELDSAGGNKSSQKAGTTRRSRLAEVHNMSERRRRDRINEKMKALQELIPHSNKSDKASMLDEAIEYMKSLQWQLQLMWMGSGMAPMMLPGMQHYMSYFGMGMGPPMLPVIQNLMCLSRLPLVEQAVNMATSTNQYANYQNQMQSSSFAEQYAKYGIPYDTKYFAAYKHVQLLFPFSTTESGINTSGQRQWIHWMTCTL